MQDLVSRYGAANIVIVAHSLGNLMVQNYVRKIDDQGKAATFQAIVFSRPDVDRQSFSDCLPSLKACSKRLFVLSSDNDPNIYASSLLRSFGVKFAQAAVLPTRMSLQLGKRIKSPGVTQTANNSSTGAASTNPTSAATSVGDVPSAGATGETATGSGTTGTGSGIDGNRRPRGTTATGSGTTATGAEGGSSTGAEMTSGTAASSSSSSTGGAKAHSSSDPFRTDAKKARTRRMGQVKAAREFSQSVEVYDLSSFRIGHGIPYRFIADTLFNIKGYFDLKKDVNGVVTVAKVPDPDLSAIIC